MDLLILHSPEQSSPHTAIVHKSIFIADLQSPSTSIVFKKWHNDIILCIAGAYSIKSIKLLFHTCLYNMISFASAYSLQVLLLF